MIEARNYKEYEFQQCNPPCSLQDMDQSHMHMLDNARDIAGIPFKLKSAYRSEEWDLSKGRSGKGDHPQGKGTDIECTNSSDRWKIVTALIEAGCKRIGIAKNFVHAGSGNGAQDVIWLY